MRKNFTTYLLVLCTMLFTACESFLDVHPSTEIEASDLFDTEDGYKDALNGLYISMTSTSLYGRDLTYGLLDVIGNVYYDAGSGVYGYALMHDYENAEVEGLINAIWREGYNVIANANSLIENLELKEPTFFAEDNYNVIYGEALAVRALMHFDLLRLFAPSLANDPAASGIPYVTQLSYNITPTSSVDASLDAILADLERASEMLAESDPVYTNREITGNDDGGYLLDRYYRLNYYAVKAIMAQAYLWKGENAEALASAQEVINSERYIWTSVDYVATSEPEDRDRTFTSETIFALQSNQIEDNILGYLYGARVENTAPIFVTYSSWLDLDPESQIFPASTHSSDWRNSYFIEPQGDVDNYYVSSKLWQTNMPVEYTRRMPVLRLPEMYLICAEADIANAPEYLNEIRRHRGVTAEVTTTAAPELLDEILLEYYREYITEGKLFYYSKRHNRDYVGGGTYYNLTMPFDLEDYTLPMPQQEIEYGNR